jgi:1,4-alpha-glucan branching enzyme
MNCDSGWAFCSDVTNTLRFVKPSLIQNAEFWPFEFDNYPRSTLSIVTPVSDGGTGFDVVQHDSLRVSVRGAVQSASFGQSAQLSFDAIAGGLYPPTLAYGQQAVPCVENHDIVKVGTDLRLPALADGSNHRSCGMRKAVRASPRGYY